MNGTEQKPLHVNKMDTADTRWMTNHDHEWSWWMTMRNEQTGSKSHLGAATINPNMASHMTMSILDCNCKRPKTSQIQFSFTHRSFTCDFHIVKGHLKTAVHGPHKEPKLILNCSIGWHSLETDGCLFWSFPWAFCSSVELLVWKLESMHLFWTEIHPNMRTWNLWSSRCHVDTFLLAWGKWKSVCDGGILAFWLIFLRQSCHDSMSCAVAKSWTK